MKVFTPPWNDKDVVTGEWNTVEVFNPQTRNPRCVQANTAKVMIYVVDMYGQFLTPAFQPHGAGTLFPNPILNLTFAVLDTITVSTHSFLQHWLC